MWTRLVDWLDARYLLICGLIPKAKRRSQQVLKVAAFLAARLIFIGVGSTAERGKATDMSSARIRTGAKLPRVAHGTLPTDYATLLD